MNEELRRALKQEGRYWRVCDHDERYWEGLWSAIERWHRREVALLTGERDGARQARDLVLKDNQRLRELSGRLTSEVEAMREANADHQKQVAALQTGLRVEPEAPKPAPVMSLCTRCGRVMAAGTNVGHRVLADGTIGREHWYSCPAPGAAP